MKILANKEFAFDNSSEPKELSIIIKSDVHGSSEALKNAIEKKFEVKVDKVRTINYKGKMKNTSVRSNGKVLRTSGFRANWKKAIVTLSDGQKIDIVGGEI